MKNSPPQGYEANWSISTHFSCLNALKAEAAVDQVRHGRTTIRRPHDFFQDVEVGGMMENFRHSTDSPLLAALGNAVGAVGSFPGRPGLGEATAATVDASAGFGYQSWLANASGDLLEEGLPVDEGALRLSWRLADDGVDD